MSERLQAGRELDRAIGVAVFGYHLYRYDKDIEANCYWMLLDGEGDPVCQDVTWRSGERGSEQGAWEDCPRFSQDIAAAWPIMEHFRSRRCNVYLNAECGWQSPPDVPQFAATIEWMVDEPAAIESVCEMGATMPLAICRAALEWAKGWTDG